MPRSIPTFDLLHKYGPDYKVIFVGDASMSPYEIAHPGGSVEHWNPEAGHRLARPRAAAVAECSLAQPGKRRRHWGYTHSIAMIRDIFVGPHVPADSWPGWKARRSSFRASIDLPARWLRFRSGLAENRGFREPERSVLSVRQHRKRRKPLFAGRPHLNLGRRVTNAYVGAKNGCNQQRAVKAEEIKWTPTPIPSPAPTPNGAPG